jgi:hypothetical protein
VLGLEEEIGVQLYLAQWIFQLEIKDKKRGPCLREKMILIELVEMWETQLWGISLDRAFA